MEEFACKVSHEGDYKILKGWGTGFEVLNRLRTIFDRHDEGFENVFDQFIQADPSWIRNLKANALLFKTLTT
ncbi:MAG: hypothetical protein HC875_37300 [Anaerolineales bacterium]|nr:hypothetical protein [Anaerolineales bacterium]